MTEILPPPVVLAVVPKTSRYDVVIRRAMVPGLLSRWYWSVDLAGHRVADGFARSERDAERKADAGARRHAHPPATARHVPPRYYSINL